MHKKFDFTQLGGFPLEQERLKFMQEAYEAIDANLVAAIGNNCIVSGVIVTELAIGYDVADGFIIHNGELLPFVGSNGGLTLKYSIIESNTALEFGDGIEKTVQFYKYAARVSIGQFNISDLTRLNTDLVTLSQLTRSQHYSQVRKYREEAQINLKYDLKFHKGFGDYCHISGDLYFDEADFMGNNPSYIMVPEFPFKVDEQFFEGFDFNTVLHIAMVSSNGDPQFPYPYQMMTTVAPCGLSLAPSENLDGTGIKFNCQRPGMSDYWLNLPDPGPEPSPRFINVMHISFFVKIQL
ncbi:MAG: hypothetical protein RBS07_15730 [Lentimicrobium sp.]|jgi:hypothetical protein|nr:hypothetical protein [Lentimicrobium sp.]